MTGFGDWLCHLNEGNQLEAEITFNNWFWNCFYMLLSKLLKSGDLAKLDMASVIDHDTKECSPAEKQCPVSLLQP